MRTSLLVVLLVVLVPAVTRAEPSPSSVFDRAHIGVEVLAGLATPLGFTGLSVIVAPHERVSVELGAGLGAKGTQRAAMVRLHPYRLSPTVLLGMGAGLSEGEYSWYYGSLLPRTHKHWDNARWANAEGSVAINHGRLQVRLFAGYSRQLTPDSGCQGLDDEEPDEPPALCTGSGGHGLYYTGAALRLATPLGF